MAAYDRCSRTCRRGRLKVARGDQERDELRERLRRQNRTRDQIATAMMRKFKDRPRPAWRHAHGWTQDDAAARFNEMVGDQQASMTGNRISDFERWPFTKGPKPTVRTLRLLAMLYETRASNLIDSHDCQKLDSGDLLALSAVDFVIVPHQLPGTISNFVGRTRELDILTTQSDQATEGAGTVVITAIGGTAGIGKTTLAVHWARTHIDQFPDGQLYVDLHGFDPSGNPVAPDTAIRGFLDAFRVPPEKIPVNFDDQAALYRTLVEDRQLVIVLDNARDADQVWPLLPGSPRCLVLVTSRQQLGSLVARRQAVHITLEFMTAEEARQLLISFLGEERIHAEPEAVDELIRYCIGLPTALTIAAARIQTEPHTSLTTLVGQLREERQRLTALSIRGSLLTDIRAVFSWSYTALTPQAARLFRLLGLHPGPDIGTRAAASLAALPEHDTGSLLGELTQAHLLEEHIPDRYQFHDLLRVYATEQATNDEPEPQQQAARHRALDYYLHTGFTADRHLDPHRKPITLEAPQPGVIPDTITSYEQALEWFTTEHGVLLAATNYAAAHGLDTHAWQLPWTLAVFLTLRGHWHNQAATQQTALAAANRLDDRAAQALAYGGLAYAHIQLGHYTNALVCLQQALTLYQELGDRDGQARTHGALGMFWGRQSHYTEAIAHDQHAVDLYRATGNRVWQARALNSLGWYHALLGHHQQALTHCQQALNISRELGDHDGEAAALDSLGYTYQHIDHHDQAITHYQQSITLYRDLDNHYYQARALMKLGDARHATGNFATTREAWQQALAILDRLGHPDAGTVRVKLDGLDNDAGN